MGRGSRVTEMANRNRLAEVLMQDGWGVFVPLIDDGIDLIAYREDTREFRLIQQKARWTIDRKYIGRGLWVAFPDNEHWYLVPHDRLADTAPDGTLESKSWTGPGIYSRATLSKAMREQLAAFRLAI